MGKSYRFYYEPTVEIFRVIIQALCLTRMDSSFSENFPKSLLRFEPSLDCVTFYQAKEKDEKQIEKIDSSIFR